MKRLLTAGRSLPGHCPACGERAPQVEWQVIVQELAKDWGLNAREARWMNLREGRMCANCMSNLRSQQLAHVLAGVLDERSGAQSASLAEAATGAGLEDFEVAEINGAGSLHPFLQRLPNLAYSEYGSSDPAVASEDLTALSYRDRQFDVVVTSDTLEHVSDVEKALAEILRVLKPGGEHIFTVPVIWGRMSRTRAELRNGKLTHLLQPSFHGLYSNCQEDLIVFHEFGDDFLDRLDEAGFDVEIVRDGLNPLLCVFRASRPAP